MFPRILPPLALLAFAAFAASPTFGQSSATPASCYPPLTLATNSVPQATAGVAYQIALKANGGQPPYRWSFGRSNLPAGFSLSGDGSLTGTPASAGSYVFNVVISDSLHSNVTGQLALNVVAGASTPPPSDPLPTQPVLPPTNPAPPPRQPTQSTPPPTQPTQPTQPPPTQPPPTDPPTGKALTACGDLASSGTYYLASDVSSAGTCFGIDADNITLNLNGHTITYGTGGGSTPTPAIEGHDSWWKGSPNYVGNSYSSSSAHGGLEVYGGTIVQSKNSAPFSPVFSFGEGTFSSAPYIHDITATFQNQGAAFYYSAYLPPGARIENNTIYDNVTNIQFPGQGVLSARSAFQGQAIMITGNDNQTGSGDIISGNKIVGSPQGGVRSTNQNTVIENNDISMNAVYSNDFCADIPANGQVVKNNNCHPISGRGFHINAGNDTVSGNTITVTELKQNAEYNGCELGGAYGIQLEDDPYQHNSPAGSTVSGNTIIAKAGDCNAIGIRLTGLSAASGGTFTGNTVTTSNTGGSGKDFGISVSGADADGVTITENTFTSDYAYAEIDWDGGNSVIVGKNTWLGSPKFTFNAGDGGCAPGQSDSGAACPVSFTFTDSLPDSVSCGAYSVATVKIGGKTTVCTPKTQ